MRRIEEIFLGSVKMVKAKSLSVMKIARLLFQIASAKMDMKDILAEFFDDRQTQPSATSDIIYTQRLR